MIRIAVYLLAIVMTLLSFSACDDYYPGPTQSYCSLNADGSGFLAHDTSLLVKMWGRAYYLSDDLIFHVSTKLMKRSMSSAGVVQLTPDSLSITDTRYLSFDQTAQMVYFAANKAIYRIGFSGTNLTRLSPYDGGNYSAPVLSIGGDYLTSIRDKRIMRLKLSTGEWSGPFAPVTAHYAVYFPESGEFYYFSKYREYNKYRAALCRVNQANADSTLLMNVESVFENQPFRWGVSRDQRYLAMLETLDSSSSSQSTAPLMIYDRDSAQPLTIESCFSFAFSPADDSIFYSRYMYGMADLMKLNMQTGTSTRLWDGYHSRTSYSHRINDIYIRGDGLKLHISGYTGFRRAGTSNKSIAQKISGIDW